MPAGDDLLRLAVSRPADAMVEATQILDGRPHPLIASVAHQARGIVLRDAGQGRRAIAELRHALTLARNAGDRQRAADVQATLGATLVLDGRTRAGLAALDEAIATSSGVVAARALMRRGTLLSLIGRHDEGLVDLNRAVTRLRRLGDSVWEARARTHRFVTYAALGQAARADRDLAIAERLHAEAGQELESAMAVQNRGDVAFQAGDLPAALRFLDDAAERFAALDVHRPNLVFDRCKVLLAAGLATEALAEADAGVEQHAGEPAKRAELLFAAARAAQAVGRQEVAADRAAAARDLFRAQRRAWWEARATFVLVQSRYDAGARDGRLRAQAGRIADRLDALGAEEAPTAHLLAGRLAAGDGRLDDADRHLARAARFRGRGPSFGHAAGWLAQALRAEARGATAAALSACRRGLLAAAGHQDRLGAVELRAHAAAYGTELAAIGQRHAVARGDARMLLTWSERWRAGALTVPAARPPDDRDQVADLAALRDVMGRLDAARATGSPLGRLEQDRRRLESAIRSRTWRAAGSARPAHDREATGEILDGLGDHLLVELVALDGTLHAVTADRGRVRLHVVGPVAAAEREVELTRFMLRRLAFGRPPPDALRRLDVAGARLQEVLLGAAASMVDGRSVVVVPPGRLHAVPWAVLPALRGAAVRVAPSAALWLRAHRRRPPRRERVVVVVGPGLRGTSAEVARIAAGYPGPVVLGRGDATAGRVLAALDGASTAHVAAHGVFRADNPLFSSLRLDDGPLTVYDLGRLRRAPHHLILSSCESAVAAPVGGDELLGTLSALVPRGTASLLASVVLVNDAAAAGLMVDFHDALHAGKPFAEALLAARDRTGDDPVAAATALSFVALGR